MEKTSCHSVTPESYDHALYERFQAPIVPCWEGDPVYIDPEPSEPPPVVLDCRSVSRRRRSGVCGVDGGVAAVAAQRRGVMSYYLVNPSCMQGDPGNPPEYDTDDPAECVVCGEVFDADDLDDDSRCHDCAANAEGGCDE